LSKLKITLKNYYKKKRDLSEEEFPDFHDEYLSSVFLKKRKDNKGLIPASGMIKKYSKDILESVALCTGERKFLINDILKKLGYAEEDIVKMKEATKLN